MGRPQQWGCGRQVAWGPNASFGGDRLGVTPTGDLHPCSPAVLWHPAPLFHGIPQQQLWLPEGKGEAADLSRPQLRFPG